MKKTFLYIGFLISLWGCQQEIESLEEMKNRQPDDKATVLFQPVMPADITHATDIVPMSRATDDTIRAHLYNTYKAIFLKKIENNWFIDTVITEDFIPKTNPWDDIHIAVRRDTRLNPIRVELRPGQYKMALFLNPYALSWNNSLKPGTFVATDEDLSAGKNLPTAATQRFNTKGLMISMEIFSGSTDFTVGKNDHLETNNSPVSLKVQMHRRVARLRYLLKINQPSTGVNFGRTQHWMVATLKAPTGKIFCEGLNVLGLPAYTEKKPTELPLYISAETDKFYSEKDGNIYQMPVNLPEGFVTPDPSGPTDFAPFILADEPMDCTLWVERFDGKSGGIAYRVAESFPFTLESSVVNGYAFEVDTSYTPTDMIGRARPLSGVDARQSFHLYYELNPVIYYLPEQP